MMMMTREERRLCQEWCEMREDRNQREAEERGRERMTANRKLEVPSLQGKREELLERRVTLERNRSASASRSPASLECEGVSVRETEVQRLRKREEERSLARDLPSLN